MTTRKWVGGGTNLATNGSDWSPTGVPQPGDKLTMTSGTMNIVGNALAGDQLVIPSGTVHLNLSSASVNLNPGGSGINPQFVSDVIDMSGTNTLTYTGADSSGTVNLAAGAVNGDFSLSVNYASNPIPGSSLIINGQSGSEFVNTGTSVVGNLVQINTAVTGVGSFNFVYNGVLEFMQSVDSGESVNFPRGSGFLRIDDPTQFQGLVTLSASQNRGIVAGDMIDLKQLAMADSYTCTNDLLSIYSGGTVIDTLRLVNQSGTTIRLIEGTSDLYVLGATDTYQPAGTILPLHT